MKKYLLLPVFALLVSSAFAQKAVVFKIKYLPNHNYATTGKTSMTINTDLSAVPAIADKLKEQGITQPITAQIETGTTGSIITGTSSGANGFSVVIETGSPSIDATINGNAIPIPGRPNGVKVYAHVSPDAIFKIDSVSGTKINDTTGKFVEGLMNNVVQIVKFPAYALKPGDTFTQDVPFNLPMGKGIAVDIKGIYKLISITGNQANFDVAQTITMNMDMKGIAATLSGTGVGKMVYDIKNQFPVTVNSDLDMKVNAKVGTMSIDATAKITTGKTFTISERK